MSTKRRRFVSNRHRSSRSELIYSPIVFDGVDTCRVLLRQQLPSVSTDDVRWRYGDRHGGLISVE